MYASSFIFARPRRPVSSLVASSLLTHYSLFCYLRVHWTCACDRMPLFTSQSSSSGPSKTETSTDTTSTADAHATDPKALEQILSLSGHVGHLTPAETQALERFRTLITDAKLYTPASESNSSRPSHSEATLW